MTTEAVLCPTPGRASRAARSAGTAPPWRSSRIPGQLVDSLALGGGEPAGADEVLDGLPPQRAHGGRVIGVANKAGVTWSTGRRCTGRREGRR